MLGLPIAEQTFARFDSPGRDSAHGRDFIMLVAKVTGT
jgi:hypothetical protein